MNPAGTAKTGFHAGNTAGQRLYNPFRKQGIVRKRCMNTALATRHAHSIPVRNGTSVSGQ